MGSGASKNRDFNTTQTAVRAGVKFKAPITTEESNTIDRKPVTVKNNAQRQSIVGDNKRHQSTAPVLSLIESTKAESEGVRQILRGNPQYGYESKPKIVRIFTSSTFTDTSHERNYLMERVYPKLKDFCQKFGYEFQVVDMRWGVREDAANDHMATELCMRELKACQKLSTGPNFVSFLSHKYGYRPFPRVIEADEFDLLTDEVTEEEEALIDKWFLLDENTVPAMYTLQPISRHFPNFLSKDEKLQKAAKDAWWDVFLKLQTILCRGAKENLTDYRKRHNYLMSVTEREIEAGMLNAEDTEKHCLWFKRIFDDIESVSKAKELSRYHEYKASDALSIGEVKSQIQELRDVQIPSKVPNKNIYSYNIKWKSPGVNPSDASHAAYLSRLCSDFIASMETLIRAGIQAATAQEGPDPVIAEILEHSAFRHSRCTLFSGRTHLLKSLEQYVTGSSHQPLIVISGSGSGKTSVLAKAAELAWDWLGGKGAVVCRFLGTTTLSSSIKPLLQTLNQQLLLLYGKNVEYEKYSKAENMMTLVRGFQRLMGAATSEIPLLLVLDSLDNIDKADGGRQLEWLPRQLPKHVKIILSMRPEEQYGVFPRCKTIFVNEGCYRVIQKMEPPEVEDVIDNFLAHHERELTPLQRRVLLEGFKVSPSPLYLRLALDESLRWHSYDPQDVTRLYSSVPAMIAAFFQRIEKEHGSTLVSFALAYFTAAQNGLSETEMEDLLSLNDTVLADVYQYWVPPVRRLPPLLWVRIKTELDPYLAKRAVEGVQVYTWNFGLFASTCLKRYLANDASKRVCHIIFSEYFQGLWADKPKPYKDKKGEPAAALRYVAKQPLRFDNHQYNLRKLNQLPYHLTVAGNKEGLKAQVLCNYEFLLAKISAVGISAVLKDYKMAQTTFKNDEDIAIIMETLQLSQHAIEDHPKELAGQLIGRLHMNVSANDVILQKAREMLEAGTLDSDSVVMVKTLVEMLDKLVVYQNQKYSSILSLLSAAHASTVPVLTPHTACLVKPGGQLLHKLSGHHEPINAMDTTSNGRVLATGSDDNTIKLWDVASGELLVSCQVNSDVLYLVLAADNSCLVATTVLGTVYVIDVTMGTIIMERDNIGGSHSNLPVVICEVKKSMVVVVLSEQDLILLDPKSLTFQGTCKHDLDLSGQSAGKSIMMLGHKNYVAYTSHNSNEVCVATLTDKKQHSVQKYTVFPRPEKPSKRKLLINCMTVIPRKDRIAICNGYTQDIYFLELANGNTVLKIPNHHKDNIQDLYFFVPEDLLYYAANHQVETINWKKADRRTQFPHPCKVRKVVACDKQFVVTLGEDDVLRIWDKSMRAFTPDVSMFTGKVTVHSSESMKMFKSILDTFSNEFVQNLDDARAILTSEDVTNYWTQDSAGSMAEEVTTCFYRVPGNQRYLVVTQNSVDPDNRLKRYTQCVTIWDLNNLQCIRRFFPIKHSMYIHGVLSSKALVFTDLGDDGSPMYVLDITGKTFKPILACEGPPKLKLGCDLVVVTGTNYAVGENTTGELTLYDMAAGEVNGILSPKSTPTGSKSRQNFKYIKVMPGSQVHILAVLNDRFLCKWNVDNKKLQWEIDLHKHITGQSASRDEEGRPIITIQWTRDSMFVIVQLDLTRSAGQAKVAKSVAILKNETGSYVGDLSPLSSAESAQTLPLLRYGKDKYLQLVGISETGKAHIMQELKLSKYTSRLLVTSAGTRCLTWCGENKEQKVSLWEVNECTCTQLGAFTVDEQLHDLYVDDNGQQIVVSTATGLVRLQLTGKDVTPAKMDLSSQAQLYEDQDLNVPMEIEG